MIGINRKRIYAARADIAKALAHPVRIELIDRLADNQEVCVCELTEKLAINQSSVSKHLAILKRAGIVVSRKEGLQVYYKLQIPCVTNFFNCMDRILLEDLHEREKCFHS